MARTSAEQARLESILFQAIQTATKKRIRAEHIPEGSETAVSCTISGTVGRSTLSVEIAGDLLVGVKQTTSTSCAPDANRVIAYLLDQFPQVDRDRLLAQLPAKFEELNGELPKVPDARIAQAAELMTRLRGAKTTTKKGAVTFRLEGDDSAGSADDE